MEFHCERVYPEEFLDFVQSSVVEITSAFILVIIFIIIYYVLTANWLFL